MSDATTPQSTEPDKPAEPIEPVAAAPETPEPRKAPEPRPATPIGSLHTRTEPAQASDEQREVKRARDEQPKHRAENQDFLRVLNMYGGAIPAVYVANVNVAQDWVMGRRDLPPADLFPPESRGTAEITEKELIKIKQVYQHPAKYAIALAQLRERRCVVLRGKPHIGKRAAAIRLALDVRAESRSIWEISGEEDLLNHLTQTLRVNTIYVIDGLLRDRGRALKAIDINTLEGALRQKNSDLIICAKPEVPFPSDATRRFEIVDLEPPAASTAILVEEHLIFYGGFSRVEIQAVLEQPAIAEIIEKGLSPMYADRLALQLTDVLRAGDPPENALRGFAAAADEEVQEWLDETADNVEDSAFRIALAVFNGARYPAISEAAQALLRKLRPEPETRPKDAPTPAYVSPLKKKDTVTVKLQKARAKIITRTEPTEYSEAAQIDVVELENPAYSNALIKYLWMEIDEWRQPLLDWLCAYAESAPRDLRLRAAGAIGALAGLDFEYIRGRIFRTWARGDAEDADRRRSLYRALADALGVLIWIDARAEDVLGLLKAWSSDGDETLRWAAARAYAQVGLRYPREAINQWRLILESKGKIVLELTESLGVILPHPLHMSVIDAIISLFLRATEFPHRLRPVYEQALDGLADWVEADAKDRNAEQIGLPLFLALTPIGYPPDDNTGNPDDWPPAMLQIVGTQPDSHYRQVLAKLMRHALNSANLGQHAIEVLEIWTEAVEKKNDRWWTDTLLAFYQELLGQPGTTDRERGRLRVQLTRWATRPKTKTKQPLTVAGTILTELKLS